jgi:hypothetical protein
MISRSRRMFKAKALTAVIVTGIFGLAACGGGSSDNDDSTVTTVRQKNAALSFTTTMPKLLPNLKMPQTTAPKTVTTPMPVLGGNTGPRPTTTAPKAAIPGSGPTTTQVKTVTTPMPNLKK